MGRIVFAWEFGGGLGHIQADLPLAKKLQERGHEVICIMKNVIGAGKILGQHGIKVMQAPIWQVKIKKLENTFNYAEALFNQGYLVERGLTGMTKAWRNLFGLVNPDILIADHAPTALIAARGTSIKTVLYGAGFLAPPIQNPMPSIIPRVTPPKGLLEYSERKLVKTINVVLDEAGSPLLKNLSDLFVVDENILSTFQEIDHYRTREKTKYWGPVINLSEGESPDWPATEHSKKIFCYLKPTYPYLGELLGSLQQIKASVIIFLPNVTEEIKVQFRSTNMIFSERPLNMSEVCEECDMVICHSGHGTIAVTLLHGRPLMLLPEHNQLEQVLLATNIAMQNFGEMILTSYKKRDYQGTIKKVLFEPEFTAEAEKFAQKYKEFDPAKQLDEIADRCEELIGL